MKVPLFPQLLSHFGVALSRKRRSRGEKFIAGVFVEIDDATRAGTDCESDDEDMSHATPTPGSPPMSWKSTTRRSFIVGQPLCVSDPDHPSEEITDAAEALSRKMQRAQALPGTWYYSSNHVMVNVERRNHMVAPLTRLAELDELAREHAATMASQGKLSHSDPFKMHASLAAISKVTRIMGENVTFGESIRDIHKATIENREQKSNILHRRYTHFGMGTAKSSDGRLFLCQVYRG